MCMPLLLLLLTSRGCSAREKKCVYTKGRELIKHFRRLLHDLLISQLKCAYTYGSKGKMGSKEFFLLLLQVISSSEKCLIDQLNLSSN
jgi:hypothetical protein